MPYLSCPNCSLPTYIVSEGVCPACGAQLKARRAGAGPRPTRGGPEDFVRAELSMLCRELATDSALRLGDRRRARARALGGRRGRLRVGLGRLAGHDLRAAAGRPDRRVVSDAAAEPSLATIAGGARRRGHRVHRRAVHDRADARRYVLCCLARRDAPGPRRVRRALRARAWPRAFPRSLLETKLDRRGLCLAGCGAADGAARAPRAPSRLRKVGSLRLAGLRDRAARRPRGSSSSSRAA